MTITEIPSNVKIVRNALYFLQEIYNSALPFSLFARLLGVTPEINRKMSIDGDSTVIKSIYC